MRSQDPRRTQDLMRTQDPMKTLDSRRTQNSLATQEFDFHIMCLILWNLQLKAYIFIITLLNADITFLLKLKIFWE